MSFTLLSATATLLTIVGALLWLRRIPPNRLIGFRTPSAATDARLWYAVNAHVGARLVGLGSVLQLITLAARLQHVLPQALLAAYLVTLNLGFALLLHGGVRMVAQRRIARGAAVRVRSRA